MHPDLVIFLPGITGSVLMKDRQVLWGYSPTVFWNSVVNNGLDLLEINGDDSGDEDLDDGIVASELISNVTIVPGLIKLDGYSIVSNFLQGGLGLVKNRNYYEFAYDWRRDNRVSAKKLARFCDEKLASWRKESGSSEARVILVAHSMGGLVSRYYVECLEGWKTTKNLITLGTPHRGSLDAVNGICNGLTKSVGPVVLADASRAFRSFQSLYQLLPIYPSIKDHEEGLRRVTEVILPNLDINRALQARRFHDEINDAHEKNLLSPDYQRSQFSVSSIVGIDQPTYQSARLMPEGKVQMLRAHSGKNLGGDGTVPRVSAQLTDGNGVFFANTHAFLPNARPCMMHLKGVLSGSSIDLSLFRGPGDSSGIGLDVSDLYSAGEPVVVQATIKQYRQKLTAEFRRADVEAQPIRVDMYPMDEMYTCSIHLNPGLYRVTIEEAGLEPVGDVFAVVDTDGVSG
ncbi:MULTISPECIES: hypothetical protein [unclassified Agrobacterium]|uniref:lipase/acyltransferase domain-containing protein n=1 Tax=unclassified Agrobacterium TaxID=2632611 RepID=UPI001FFE1398|nr:MULTISPECIES: hypothetical protein [unclassified Agrobacterium]